MLGLSAALMSMVAAYTTDAPAAVESADRLVRLRAEILQAVEADGPVSADLGAALALPTDDGAREERVRAAAVDAAQSVARLGRLALALLPEARTLSNDGNPHLAVDLAVATEALHGGLSGASLNLRANLQLARRPRAPPPILASLTAAVAPLAEAPPPVGRITAELSERLD